MSPAPKHHKPLAGAAFAVAFATMIGVGGTIISVAGDQFESLDALWSFAAIIYGVALFLNFADLALLRLTQWQRPLAWRRAWRRMWLWAPAVGALAGAVSSFFFLRS